jgi:Spy/CpxP family protein refolding chaperone
MKRIAFGIIAVAVVAACAVSQPGPQPPMMGHLGKIVKDLNLTEQQQKEFDKIKADMMKSMIANRSKLATARVDMQQLLKADNPDKVAIEKKIDEMGDQAAQMGKMMVAQWFTVNKMLTPDQQKTWKKALEVRPMMGNFMQGGRMRGMGQMQGRMQGRMFNKRIEIREKDDDEQEKR